MLITKNNELYSFGQNNYGQLGNGSKTECCLKPVRILKEKKVKTVALANGGEHSMVLTLDGELYGFGRNSYG
jgi:alpha-tubulin suppressor-like RCC1 family protein